MFAWDGGKRLFAITATGTAPDGTMFKLYQVRDVRETARGEQRELGLIVSVAGVLITARRLRHATP